MAVYAFETITPAQALTIEAGDYLSFATGPATGPVIAPVRDGAGDLTSFEVSFAGRTLLFGPVLIDVSRRAAISFPDDSRLVIGDDARTSVVGGAHGDALYGLGGADLLRGEAGNDLLHGNAGDDTLISGSGYDTLYAGQGNDRIDASASDGAIANGNKGDDQIDGGGGADTLPGGQGNDLISAGDGADFISGDLGDDVVQAGAGDDRVFGGDGADSLSSADGSDLLNGGLGNDLLTVAGFGRASVNGGVGDDIIVSASPDQSLLSGGAGRDRFDIIGGGALTPEAIDVVEDWESADQLSFPGASIYADQSRHYAAFVAGSFAEALAGANQRIGDSAAVYVTAHVGGDVWVFADTDGNFSDGADAAVRLVGASLADVSLANFV
jgi:Ca2+-binding RTX toxin-like protein